MVSFYQIPIFFRTAKTPPERGLAQAEASVVNEAFGRLDILVNNAGIGIVKQPQEYTLAEWNTVLATNLSSAFLCAQAAYPEMRRVPGRSSISAR